MASICHLPAKVEVCHGLETGNSSINHYQDQQCETDCFRSSLWNGHMHGHLSDVPLVGRMLQIRRSSWCCRDRKIIAPLPGSLSPMFIRKADAVEGSIQLVGPILGIEASTAELQDSLPLHYGRRIHSYPLAGDATGLVRSVPSAG